MNGDAQITITVSRFDPETDAAPRLEKYTVPLVEGLTVLGALDYIYENLDPTLAYYDHAACAQGICKTCLAQINGKAGLMCQTQISDDISVKPLDKFRIIRDLVTDKKGRDDE